MGRIIFLALVGMVTACAPDLPQDSQPDVVRALWNPAEGTLPTPTDLVRDADAQRLDLPMDPELSDAELEFRSYLNSLDGYPLQTTMALPMSDPVREGELQGALLAMDVSAQTSLTLRGRWDEETSTVQASPGGVSDDFLRSGRTYVFGLRGYEGGVRGEGGRPVVADAGFYLVRSREPLTEHHAAMPGESRTHKKQAAVRLEELRQSYLPFYEAMEQRGIPREELAVVSSFTTTARPSVWFDPDRGLIPLPNGLLIDQETDLVHLPVSEDDDEQTREFKEQFSTYDGFATTAALTIEATAPVDANTVNAETVRLFQVEDDGSVSEVVDLEHGVLDDPRTFWIKPRLRIEPSAHYVWIVTRGVTANGVPLEPQPLAALLRSEASLADGGVSQITSLDDETATMLEPWRARAAPALDWLEGQGLDRAELSAVVPFRTVSALEDIMGFRAELYEEQVPTEVTNVLTQTPTQRGLPLVLNDVETITTGQMTIRDYMDPRTRRWRADAPQQSSVDFVLTIPEGYAPGEEIPVVLFGHGLFTSRELVYMIADKLAEGGYAAFALDLPYHGRRTVCQEDSNCQGDATCDEFGQCVHPDGSEGTLNTISSPWPNGPEYPAMSGFVFVDPDDIIGSRDHFFQAALDLMQGLRVIRGADWPAATGGYALDGDDVVYLGMSLGGILGGILAGAEPTLEDFVLNVPGGNFFVLIRDSDAFSQVWDGVLAARDVQPGTDGYFAFENALRWLLDSIDPITLGPYAFEPFEWTDPVDGETKTSPVKRVLIQMAENDTVVPNSATRSLSEATGVPIETYTPAISNHGFLFDPASLEGARARNRILEFFEAR